MVTLDEIDADCRLGGAPVRLWSTDDSPRDAERRRGAADACECRSSGGP